MIRSRSRSRNPKNVTQQRDLRTDHLLEPSTREASLWSISTVRCAALEAGLLTTTNSAALQIAWVVAAATAAAALWLCGSWIFATGAGLTSFTHSAVAFVALVTMAVAFVALVTMAAAACCDSGAQLWRAAGLLVAWAQLWRIAAFRRAACWERRLACEYFRGRVVGGAEVDILLGDGAFAPARLLAGGGAEVLLAAPSALRWLLKAPLRVVVVPPTAARLGPDCSLDGGACEERRYDLARVYADPALRQRYGAAQYLSAPALLLEHGSATMLAVLLKAPDLGVDPRTLALASRSSVNACTQCWIEREGRSARFYVPRTGRSLPVRVARLADRTLYHGPRVSDRSDMQGSPALPVLTIAKSRAGRGGTLRASPFLRNHASIVSRVAADPELDAVQRTESAAMVAEMIPATIAAFDALSAAATPNAAAQRHGARRGRDGGMGGGTNEIRLTVDLASALLRVASPPGLTRAHAPTRSSRERAAPRQAVPARRLLTHTRLSDKQEAPPHDGARDHVLFYNIVLFLTTADPVAADGPPEDWRVLAFPHQSIAFTLEHGTVLVWLPQFSPHFQSVSLSPLSFNQVTLSAQLQRHSAVVNLDGQLAREEDVVAARRTALVQADAPSALSEEASTQVRNVLNVIAA